MTDASDGLTTLLAAWVTGPAPTAHAECWLEIGEQAFVDTIAVLLAGAREPAVRLVAELVDERDGAVTSLASGRAMSARSAALVDGTSAHALDLDDVDDALVAHISAVLVPTLMAAGQQHGSSGAELLDAYRVGLEACRTTGRVLGIASHYGAGWHSTGTVGTIGATAAVARLLCLDELRARRALGVAGSLAAGSRQNFGTMAKPFHVGHAASNALSAAFLAARGFTADLDQLDGPLGFLALHRGNSAASAVLGASADSDRPVGLDVKLLPCCYATHAAAEAASQVAGRLNEAAALTSVVVTVHSGGLTPLLTELPTDGAHAKFSMEYVVAVALLDRRVTSSSFENERVLRRDVQELMRKVRVLTATVPPAGSPEPGAPFAVITAHDANGKSVTARVDRPLGHVTRQLSPAQLRSKFDDCVGRSVPRARADAAYFALSELRHQSSVRDVAATVAAMGATGGRKGHDRQHPQANCPS